MFRRYRRDEVLAALIAPIVVGLGVIAWMRRDAIAGCCAQKPAVRLDAALPVDPSLRTGQLSNHLRYFVMHNAAPPTRAELRLVVNAGAVLESDDQRGLAHAVEHMVFRGTKRFPGHAIDDYLQSIGMRAGNDINASTSQDETIYQITIPTDRAGVLDTSLMILADIARDATFDPDEARQEAGVVMSEWRSRNDAATRLGDERNKLLYAGSKYAGHPVIGDTAVLRRFDVAAMRRFYDDWYRPDLMAIVAVGDFDATQLELLIGKYFKNIKMPASPRERPTITVDREQKPRAAIFSDPEATGSWLTLWHPTPEVPLRTVGDFRTYLIDELWRDLLSDRLDDASELPGSPIVATNVRSTSLARTLRADASGVLASESQEGPALEMLSREIARLSRFSVGDEELKRRTAQMLRERRNADEYSDRTLALTDGLVDQFLTGSRLITRSSAFELARDLLPTITPDDILARGRRAAIDSGTVLVLTRPTRVTTPFTAPALMARATDAFDRADQPPVDSVATIALIGAPPEPGGIRSERVVSDAKAFDWTLDNGMRVILKPTRFNTDQIEFEMIAPGGASLANDADFPSAYVADAIIQQTGVGPLPGRLLRRKLDASSLAFYPSVRDDEVELSGSLAPRDLDLLFPMFYLYLTQPRSDSAAFRRYKERMKTYARGRSADPDAVFSDSVLSITQQGHPRALRSDARFASAIDLGKAIDFWRARTANASGFTLVMTGDFTLERVRPLIARYLASLPQGKPEQPRSSGERFPKGITHSRFAAGIGPKARTRIVLSGPFDGSSEANERLNIVEDLVELALTRRLRERLGGTYDVSANVGISMIPPARYTVSIDFETSPEQIDALTTAALEELRRLHSAGPTEEEGAKVRAARVRDLDGQIERNAYWASELSRHAQMGWPLGTIVQHQPDAKLLSQETLRRACSDFLSTAEYVQVTMVPKTKP